MDDDGEDVTIVSAGDRGEQGGGASLEVNEDSSGQGEEELEEEIESGQDGGKKSGEGERWNRKSSTWGGRRVGSLLFSGC